VVGALKMFFLDEPDALAIIDVVKTIVLELCNLLRSTHVHTKKMELKC
jgi:hypothetical protein